MDSVSQIRRRANSTRNFAKLCMLGIVIVVASIIILFSFSNKEALEGLIYSPTGLYSVNDSNGLEYILEGKSISPDVQEELNKINIEISQIQERVSNSNSQLVNYFAKIASTIIQLTSAFLAIYLIQILVGFTRYQFRMADHLDATADAIEICGENTAQLGSLVEVLSPKEINFGKIPSTPIEKVIEILDKLKNSAK